MARSISKRVEETIKQQSKKFTNSEKVAAYKRASKEFDALVESGFIKRRGYTLMTIEDAHLHRQSFNSK